MILKNLKSKSLLLKASALQGSGQYSDVVDLSCEALELDPKSMLAFVLLSGGYLSLNRYEEAKDILARALKHYPDDGQFNHLMAEAIIKNGEPVDHAIPYLKAYLKHHSHTNRRFPAPMRFIMRRMGVDMDEYMERLRASSVEEYDRTQDIVAQYEKGISNRRLN